ncbi:MAG TPA: hypothetical protein VLL48_12745, partial [Longimicrobiales bacterium]|nr:hypothetical protein [Longimicrobiales bacterium]
MSRLDHRALEALRSCPGFRALRRGLPGPGDRFRLGGAVGSTVAATAAALHRAEPDRVIVLVARDPAAATSAEADLTTFLGEGEAFLYPQRETLPYESGEPHLEIGGLRVEAVEALFSGRTRLLVTTPRALQEKAPMPGRLAELRLTLSRGEAQGFQALLNRLDDRGFERSPLVEEVGQYAVRGGILDVFSFGAPEPVRIEFWGDEVESIRFFDVLDQRSTREVDEVHLLPTDFREGPGGDQTVSRSLLELLPGETLLLVAGEQDWTGEAERTWAHVRRLHDEGLKAKASPLPPGELFLDPEELALLRDMLPRVEITEEAEGDAVLEVEPPPPVDRDMDALNAVLRAG